MTQKPSLEARDLKAQDPAELRSTAQFEPTEASERRKARPCQGCLFVSDCRSEGAGRAV